MRRKSILWVDDNKVGMEPFVLALQKIYDVDFAQTILLAQRHLFENGKPPYDLVVLDAQMKPGPYINQDHGAGDRTGQFLFLDMRKRGIETYTIILSHITIALNAQLIQEYPAVEILDKREYADPDTVVMRIRQLLG